MTIGKFLKQLSMTASLLLLLGACFAAPDFTVGSLSKAFSRKATIKVSYVQRRILNFSGKPIVSSGYLVYKAPSYFAQVEIHPKKRTFIAKSGWLMIVVKGKVQRRVKLSSYPNMQVQLSTLKSVLSGKIYRLQASFRLTLQGNKQSWVLNLTPKKSRLGNVSAIQINGQKANIRALSLHYSNGNITTLSLARND